MPFIFANNASTTLDGAVLAADTSIDVINATGFPISVGFTTRATIERASDGAIEIIDISSKATNNLTVVRAREGSTALDFASGDVIEMRLTDAMLSLLQQSYRPMLDVAGATRTLDLVDAGRYLLCSNAAGCAITVPPQASVVWPDNCEIHGRGSLDSCTFVAGSGVTIDKPAGLTLEVTAKAAWTLKREAADSWVLIGNLVAA